MGLEHGRYCKSERIKEMQRHIEAIKSSEEIGVRYMQAWEEKVYERIEAREEGRIEMALEFLLERLEDLGTTPQELKTIILEEKDLDILKKWHKLAAKVSTIEEFQDNM